MTKVTAARQGYQGAIELGIDGIGEGIRLENHVIPKDKNDIELKVTVPATISPGRLQMIRIWGKAEVDGQPFKTFATNLEACA